MTTPGSDSGGPPRLQLRLFVAGQEANSRQARENLLRLCEEHLKGCYDLEIVDVLKDFRAAVADRVLVTPALIVYAPPPRTVLLGNLTDTPRVLAALRIQRNTR